MNSDLLIERLANEVRPVRHGKLRRMIFPATAIGLLVSATAMGLLIGFRHDLAAATGSAMLWVKLAYAAALGLIALAAVLRLARPDSRTPAMWLGIGALGPVLVLAGIAAGELIHEPSQRWLAMWMGGSAAKCAPLILTFSVPVLVALLLTLRRLAPTRLALTGAAAGLIAGSASTLAYSLHCGETSAMFVLTWYSMGIAAATALGALLGPRILRW